MMEVPFGHLFVGFTGLTGWLACLEVNFALKFQEVTVTVTGPATA